MTQEGRTTVPIDVLLVEEDPIVRSAVQGILESSGRVRLVAQAGDGLQALALARQLRPAVTLLDHRIPVAGRLSVLDGLARVCSVLVLTSDPDPELVADTLRGGARGYLVHGQFDPPDLVRAIVAVAQGYSWLSPQAVSVATAALREQVSQAHHWEYDAAQQDAARQQLGLTAREHEVVELLCLGLSNASIARRLQLTEKTVKNHLNHIFAKLGVRNRTEAVVRWTGG
jgi:DNA-binding NarL/FixJ family response regulator